MVKMTDLDLVQEVYDDFNGLQEVKRLMKQPHRRVYIAVEVDEPRFTSEQIEIDTKGGIIDNILDIKEAELLMRLREFGVDTNG